MWNTHRTTKEFVPGSPWLLRFFDQIRFFPVGADELLEMRAAFPHGRYGLSIDEGTFSLRQYRQFLHDTTTEAQAFKRHQQAAFDAERERWAAAGQAEFMEQPEAPAPAAQASLPEGCVAVRSPMTANVWQVAVEPGQRVEAGQRLLVLEAMKMEVPLVAAAEGVVEAVHCARAGMVTAGQHLVTLRQVEP
jgi:urea carboxylase